MIPVEARSDRPRGRVQAPGEAHAGCEVVLVLLERLRERVGGERPRVRDVEEVVAQPEQELEARADAEVVLDEDAVEARVVADARIAEVLLEGRVGARVRSRSRRQVRIDAREGVDLPQRVDAVVGHELQVEAGLEAVAVPRIQVKLSETCQIFWLKSKPALWVASSGQPKFAIPLTTIAGHAPAFSLVVRNWCRRANCTRSSFRRFDAERGDQLDGSRVHAVVEVGGALDGVEAARRCCRASGS